MAAKSKSGRPRRLPPQPPKPRPTARRPWWQYAAAAACLAAVALVLALTVFGRGGGGTSAAGLPHTPDYHSLLISPTDPERLTLGTHNGLYVSSDGGRHWRFAALSGDDAMNLARPTGKTVWLAGHQVLKRSLDGGATWNDVRPSGLPGLDIHGFAVDPRDPGTLYAAIAGQGLYRSSGGGGSFALVSRSVGGSVMALAVMPDGRILAGDMEQGLLASRDGKRWAQTLRAQVMGLAVNPSNPNRVLASGAGIALSTDGGSSWRSVLDLADGAGPIAWSTSNPRLAYAVGFNRVLYRSGDGGESWQPVGEGA
ncbi:MAG TPA: YCF48-related protein [Roseiflexaceae bacterium]